MILAAILFLAWSACARREIAYDATNGFLLTAGFTIDKKNSDKSETELRDIFIVRSQCHVIHA